MTKAQEAAIRKHGEQLLAIFPNATERDPVKLCRKLRRLEVQGNEFALRLCNGPEFVSEEAQDAVEERILKAVDSLLQSRAGVGPAIILNRDPRGYALKIPSESMCRHSFRLWSDMGGYGIIAPEIGPDGH